MNTQNNHDNNNANATPFVFFGTPDFAVTILDELEAERLMPSLVVTAPDRPAGRGMSLTPSPVKVWAEKRSIPVLTPERLTDERFLDQLHSIEVPVFVLAAYGKIIPESILSLPPRGIVNVHPSLLPRYRGPSPIESQILKNEEHIGVSLIRLDAKVDHGPLIAEEEVDVPRPMPDIYTLEDMLAHAGGSLLARTLPGYVQGEQEPHEQDHDRATHTKKFTKEDAQIDLDADPLTTYLTIQAFKRRPRAFFFVESNGRQIRVVPTEAHYSADEGLIIKRVVPEGDREMEYAEFQKKYFS